MPSWISTRNGLIAAAIAVTVAGCGGGWWFLGSDDPETKHIVTGPAAAASAPATKPAPTPPPQPTPPAATATPPAAPKATDEPELATSPVKPPDTTSTAGDVICDAEYSRDNIGELGGLEYGVRMDGLDVVPAGEAYLKVGGKTVDCKDEQITVGGKPLLVKDLYDADGFVKALESSRPSKVTLKGGATIEVSNISAGARTHTRAHTPDKVAATK